MMGQKIKSGDHSRLQIAIHATALEFGVTADALVNSRRRGSAMVVLSRQIAMYMVHIVFHKQKSDIGRLFRRNPSTVSHALKIVEECREDPVMDRRLSRLEGFLRGAPDMTAA